ncbi:unnamed protein product [Closterium sp. NIES-53]
MASARVLQQQGQLQRQHLQHSRQWGPEGPRSGGPSSGSASSGHDDGPCGYRILIGPCTGTTYWRPDHSESSCYRCLDEFHRERFGPAAISPHWPSRVHRTTASIVPAFVVDSGTTSATPSLSFTLDSGASSCFFRDCTELTPMSTPVTDALADPSVGPVVAHSTTTLLCPAAPSGVLTGYYTPSFSRNLVGVSHLHDLGVVTTFPVDKLVASCTVGTTGAPLAIFHREPGSGCQTYIFLWSI